MGSGRARESTAPGWASRRPSSIQDAVNRRIYSSPRLVRTYARRRLTPAEQAFFSTYGDSISGRPTLEIGCGAGRVTRRILELTDVVVGVDVSPAMVAYSQRVFPHGTFLVGDLRDLSPHGDAAFGVVVAAANVLDAVQHEERLGALREINRVLRPGGLFYFSSHNRRSIRAMTEARHGPRLRLYRNPYRQLRAAANYVQGRLNHPRFAPYQQFEGDHAILNDDAHGWRLLHYYIDRGAQTRQLSEAGFDLLETIGMDGRTLAPEDDDSGVTEIHYVARRR